MLDWNRHTLQVDCHSLTQADVLPFHTTYHTNLTEVSDIWREFGIYWTWHTSTNQQTNQFIKSTNQSASTFTFVVPGQVPGTGHTDGSVGESIGPAGIHVKGPVTHNTYRKQLQNISLSGGNNYCWSEHILSNQICEEGGNIFLERRIDMFILHFYFYLYLTRQVS